MLKLTTVIAATILLASCSKTPTAGGNSVAPMIDAQFIDEPVKGLSVEAASGNGKTAAQGKFKCRKGEKVKFKIAGLDLGDAVCGEKIFVDDLVSTDSDHSPVKVAAIIQSFAVGSGSGELDLSTAVNAMSANALTSVVFGADNATFKTTLASVVTQIQTDVPALASVIAAKDPDDMRDILDAALAAYSSISDVLKTVLGTLAHAPLQNYNQIEAADKLITLSGKLISNDPQDNCYDFVQARASISQAGPTAPYKFVVHKSASFDALDAYDAVTNDCKNAHWCDQGTPIAPKTITSSSISFLSKINQNDVVSDTIAVLEAKLQNGEMKLTGTFQEEGIFTDGDEDVNFSCKYSITSDDMTIPAEGPMTESGDADYTHVDIPTAATGTYSLIPNDPSLYCNNGTQELLGAGALPTSFDVSISNQSVVVSNTSSVVGTWTKNGSYKAPDGQGYTGMNMIYFNETGNWHLDVGYSTTEPTLLNIYIYHKPSGDYDAQYCSFSLTKN